ncbi:MAG: secondary thiamine-phosphate synthase enzyme YjbQ [Methanospirillum sp.]
MFQKKFALETHGEGEIVDMTAEVACAVRESGMMTGLANVFVGGSTAAVTTIEYEPGVLEDLARALNVIAPREIAYAHDRAWGDSNGRSHVRAALVGPSVSIPFRDGGLLLGTWQQIVLLELDVKPSRSRVVTVTVTG